MRFIVDNNKINQLNKEIIDELMILKKFYEVVITNQVISSSSALNKIISVLPYIKNTVVARFTQKFYLSSQKSLKSC